MLNIYNNEAYNIKRKDVYHSMDADTNINFASLQLTYPGSKRYRVLSNFL